MGRMGKVSLINISKVVEMVVEWFRVKTSLSFTVFCVHGYYRTFLLRFYVRLYATMIIADGAINREICFMQFLSANTASRIPVDLFPSSSSASYSIHRLM